MILEINTSKYNEIELSLIDGKKIINERQIVERAQSEKLLPMIDSLLKKSDFKLSDVSKICVVNKGASFTSLRIGVVTANTLAYALKIPIISKNGVVLSAGNIEMVEADYDRDPNITVPKKK
jgi:tRNA threonylcarbamoyladenosine biosynthesis protein TsaB